MEAQQQTSERVNDGGYTENLERLRAAAQMLSTALTGADLEELAEYGDGAIDLVQEAIQHGITLKEAMAWPNERELVALMSRVWDKSVAVEDWTIAHLVRLIDGRKVETWVAEYTPPPGPRDVLLHCRCERIEVDAKSFDITLTTDVPPPAVLLRALRAALGGAS